MTYVRADDIRVDTDEGRYVLLIDAEDRDTLTVDIHDMALDFYAAVRREIGPYAAEAESAKAAVAAGVSLEDYIGATVPVDEQADAYAPDDPKSPGYYERMVD